jgi:nicotinamidase/pyrazinamidase
VVGRAVLDGEASRTYDETTALLVVDVQNDFADPGGSLYVHGAERLIPRINQEIEAAQAEDALVVYTQDWHPPSTPHFQKDGGIWPVHCVHDTWGAALHPGLTLVHAPSIRKGSRGEDGYSAFSERDPTSGRSAPTELGQILRAHDVGRVAVVGLATDYCVKETALDARRLGLSTIVMHPAIAAVDLQPGDGDRALTQMREAGVQVLE